MSSSKKALPDLHTGRFRALLDLSSRFQLGPGVVTLFAVLAVLSFIVTYEWGPSQRMYVLGEVAEADIAAANSFTFQDDVATKARRDAAQKAQPVICVLNPEPVERMHNRVQELFINTNKAGGAEDLELLRLALSDETGEEITARQFALLADPAFQGLVNNDVLPWLAQRLREGVISDTRVIAGYTGGIVVRELESGDIIARMDTATVPSVRDLLLDLSIHVRNLQTGAQNKRLLNTVLSAYIMPTITPNFEDTAKSAAEAAKSVRPVVQHIMAGEIVVRQGERINQEQLSKLRALWSHEADRFKPALFSGVLICSLLLCIGLFFSLNSRGMERISQKELMFVAFLVGFTTILAKGFYVVGAVLAASSPAFTNGAQAFAVPVAGAVGLVAIVTSTKRYYITGMLMALFCTIVCNGGLSMFMFYFMSAMFGAWLIADSQQRKDVVRAMFPLVLGLVLMWLGATLAKGGEPNRFFAEFVSVLLGGFLSMVMIFAVSPLIEMLFGFTTRFSLMELMNQEHPILRQLMFNAPGTYHHSLIVANMVELAAKAIGAHSLLCKVGALYHDIGKVEKPHYFIENQFRGPNPHDKLTPTMSALVLVSHVKRGVEIAHKYRLGSEITSIIREHHGNRVIQYFFQKAKVTLGPEQSQHLQIEDFSYDGPRPSTREAALIMLADVVEASSRTLADPTPSRIKMHVHKMIRGVLAEGQLNAVDLTFKDLELVEENFTVILTGMFHKRIEYPGKHGEKEESKKSEPVLEQPLPLPLPAQPDKFGSESDKTAGERKDVAHAGGERMESDALQKDDDWHASQWIDNEDEYDDLLHGRVRRKQSEEDLAGQS
ncbi:HDIG domain-containing protein [Desulfovibrio sp. OttesenSCG-928-C06]|nr:HDIG domain-containing protein [Desulfovibrio sp. OttesenSCG-928-C06]